MKNYIHNFGNFLNEELSIKSLNQNIHYLYNNGTTTKVVKYKGSFSGKYIFVTIDNSVPIKNIRLTSHQVLNRIRILPAVSGNH